MVIVFVWGMLIMLIISALLRKIWVWHLSWCLVPIIAFLSGLIYDTNHDNILMQSPTPKKFWEELGSDQIYIIRSV